MNAIETIREELERKEAAERYARWVSSVESLAARSAPEWKPFGSVIRDKSRLRQLRQLPSQSDVAAGNVVAVGFYPGSFDDWAQVLVARTKEGTMAAWLTDELYLSRLAACAIRHQLEQETLDDFLDVGAATGKATQDEVVDMCLRKAKKFGDDESVVAASLVCAHYGMVAEENFGGGRPAVGKVAKLYGATRVLSDHEPIEVVVRECCGMGADEILALAASRGIQRFQEDGN